MKGILYQVNHLGNKYFLFGTIHLSHSAIEWPREQVVSLLEQSTSFIAEMDLNYDISLMSNGQNLPNSTSLSDYYSPAKYLKINHSIKKSFGIDLSKYRTLRPLLIEGLLAQQVVGSKALGIDHYLWEKAKSQGINCLGLETMVEQIHILHSIAIPFQVSNLMKISQNPGRYRSQIKRMVKAYEDARISQLYKSSKRRLGKYKKLMIDQRNRKMFLRLKSDLLVNNAFVAVGAGHLAGSNGLLAYLKRDGAKVKVVSP